MSNAAATYACYLGGLSVRVDGLVLEEPEPLQALKNRVVSMGDTLVMLPLPGRNPEDPSQFNWFFAPYKD